MTRCAVQKTNVKFVASFVVHTFEINVNYCSILIHLNFLDLFGYYNSKWAYELVLLASLKSARYLVLFVMKLGLLNFKDKKPKSFQALLVGVGKYISLGILNVYMQIMLTYG